MKIATLADWFGVGLIEGIRESEKCGAVGVQVYAAGELLPKDVTKEKLELLKSTLSQCHQEVTALCGELGGFGFEIEADNPAKIEYLKAVVDLACLLGSHVVTTHIGVVPRDASDPQYQVMRAAMREIGAYAAGRSVTIAIETGPETVGALSAFVDDCGPGVGINYDPANLHMLTGVDPVDGVYEAAGRIVHTHAKDGVCYEPVNAADHYHKFAVGGLEWSQRQPTCREVPLGEGGIDWNRYLKALRDVGYDGYLTIEREVKNGAEDIRMAVRFLEKELKKLGSEG